MATLNAKDFLRTLVFGHFTHPNYHQIKFTFDNGVLGFEMKDTRSGNEFKGSCDVSNCEDAYFVMRQVGKQSVLNLISIVLYVEYLKTYVQ